MLSLLRQRNYALLFWGGLVSQIGTYMLIAALPYYVYATTRSVTASGAAALSEILPGVVFNAFGGVLADRLPRKVAMAAGNGSRGLIILPLLAVHGPSTIWVVYVVGFLNQTVAALAGPFGNAALPHVVPSRDLPAANAGFSAASSAAVLAGSPLGGLLLQRAGLPAVVLVDAVSFIVPTIAILLIDVPLEDRMKSLAARGHAVARLARELLLGWQYVRENPIVARVFLVSAVNLLATGAFFVAFAPFVRHVLHGSAEFYSWSLTLQALSGIAGALLMGATARRAGPRTLVAGGLAVLGLLALVEVLAVRQPVTLAVSLLVGYPSELIGASLNSLLQVHTRDAYRGRVYGAYGTATSVTLLAGSTVATVITDHVGIREVLGAASLLLMVAGFVAMRAVPNEMPSPPRPG